MKFIFADSLDYVDPGYDFLTDRFSPGRQAYWDDQFPHEILGFADPIYALSRAYLGTEDKSVPGVRKFMQDVGQWGRGVVSDEYPLSVTRALFTHDVRRGRWNT